MNYLISTAEAAPRQCYLHPKDIYITRKGFINETDIRLILSYGLEFDVSLRANVPGSEQKLEFILRSALLQAQRPPPDDRMLGLDRQSIGLGDLLHVEIALEQFKELLVIAEITQRAYELYHFGIVLIDFLLQDRAGWKVRAQQLNFTVQGADAACSQAIPFFVAGVEE